MHMLDLRQPEEPGHTRQDSTPIPGGEPFQPTLLAQIEVGGAGDPSRVSRRPLTRSLSAQPEGTLSLSSVYLYCGGTWARILDLMRDRRIHASLGYQRGAEFETDPTMANGVFCKSRKDRDSFFPSFAECYVHGEDMPNPFLEPPGPEISDSSFGPVPDGEDDEEDQDVSDVQG
ncbi:hypothetical protein F5883DRAFT_111390 [Diaporthe sp. PMI_573]|nr:hypothetical protein F5883DRAFT_111390 [Diaporthaceae sp. PMI_573]